MSEPYFPQSFCDLICLSYCEPAALALSAPGACMSASTSLAASASCLKSHVWLEPIKYSMEDHTREGPFVVEGKVRCLTSAACDRIFLDTGVKASERARKNAAVAGKLLFLSGPADAMESAKDVYIYICV